MEIIGGRRKWPKKVTLEWLMKSDFDLQNMPEEKVRKSKNKMSRKTKPDKVGVNVTILPNAHSQKPKELYKWFENPVWIDAIGELRREILEKKCVQRGVQKRSE